MNVQGAFNELFRTDVRDNFRDEYDAFEPEHTKFLKSDNMTKPEMSATIMTGPSRQYEIQDGEGVPYADLIMGPKVSVVDKEYSLGIRLSRKAVEDDQYGKLKKGARWLAEASRMTQEYRAGLFLDDSFTGTYFLGIDGLKLCSTAHTYIGTTGTWANTPATPVGLSVSGITALRALAMLQKNHNGDPIRVKLNKLIISNSASEEQKAIQIIGSAKEPFTAENQDNAIPKVLPGLSYEISHFKTGTKSYHMIDSRLNDAYFLTRRAPRTDDSFDFNTKAALYSTDQRFALWFVDPRGWYGANPS